MDRKSEIRALLIVIVTLVGVGFFFWGVSALVSRMNTTGTETVQEGDFEAPSDASEEFEGENIEGSGEQDSEGEGAEGESEGSADSEEGLSDSGGDPEDLSEAEKLLREALVESEESGRPVFLRFGAPWCPGCWQLAGFLERLEIQSFFSKQFIDTSMDVDTLDGARTLLSDLAGDGSKLPWYAIFGSTGELIASSSSYDQTIGFPPTTTQNRDLFVSLFEKSEVLSEEEMVTLEESLDAHIRENTR